MRLESSPPESSKPTGTSAIRCCAVTSSSAAWSSFSISPAFVAGPSRLRIEVTLKLRFLVRPHAQKVPWRQLMYAIQNGAVFLKRISEFEKLTDRAAIERGLKPRKR